MCCEDLTGRRFGKLIVIERKGSNKNKKSLWLVHCDCGKEKIVIGSNLTNGSTKSCGCLVSKYRDGIPVGTKFGQLTVLSKTPRVNSKGSTKYHCLCDCGEECDIDGVKLVNGHTKSCGCYRKEQSSRNFFKDETGKTYGNLTVLGFSHYDKQGLANWRVRCKCGTEFTVVGNSLRFNKTVSCGCITSIGEYTIKQILNKKCIDYNTQYSFDDLRSTNGGMLRFDFAFCNKSGYPDALLEYDGNIHFSSDPEGYRTWNTKESLAERILRDKMKNDYCVAHNIPLIRIPYTDLPKLTSSDDYLLSLIIPYITKSA